MKELTTSTPLVLGLIGLPGAGKSRFAADFSTMFGAPVIEAGQLARNIFGQASPTKAQKLGIKRAYHTLAAELFKTKRMFVLDGETDTYAGRSEIRALAKKAGYDVLWLWVQTSEAVARERCTKQKRGATTTVISPQEFDRRAREFEAPRPGEDHVVLSGQRTFNSQARPILKKIAEGHEAKLQAPRPASRGENEADPRPPRRNIFIR